MNKLLILIYLILTYLSPVVNQNIQLSLSDKEIDKAMDEIERVRRMRTRAK